MATGEDRSGQVLGVVISMLSLSTLFLGGRLGSKLFIVRKISVDDYLLVIGWIFGVGCSIALIYSTTVGMGKHMDDVSSKDTVAFRKTLFVFSLLYSPALTFTRASFLVFYLGLSKKTHRPIYLASWIILVFVVVTGTALTFLLIFQCQPMNYLFVNNTNHPVRCIGLVDIYLVSAPVSLASDVSILLVPLPLLTSLRLPNRQKIILISTFLVGTFVTAVDIIRLYFLQKASYASTGTLTTSNYPVNDTHATVDLAWYGASSFSWSSVQIHVAIACACVPAMKPLVKRFMPTLIDSRIGYTTDKRDYPTGKLRTDEKNSKGHRDTASDGPEDEVAMISQQTKSSKGSWLKRGSRKPKAATFTFDKLPPITMIQGKQSVKYCCIMAILYLVWGFSFGILNSLNSQTVLNNALSAKNRYALITTYFAGYLITPPLFGIWSLKHLGFRMTSSIGLCINGLGLLAIWPSGVYASMVGFYVSNAICGIGLSILETSADTFVILCGPMEYATLRFCMAQAMWPLSGIFSLIISNYVLFPPDRDVASQWTLQWAYVVLFFINILLMLIYYYINLPEASDQDYERRDELHIHRPRYINAPKYQKKAVILMTFSLGILTQFFHIGAQEILDISIADFRLNLSIMGGGRLTISPVTHSYITCTIGIISRIAVGLLSLRIHPRILLLTCYACSLAILATAASIRVNSNILTALSLTAWVFQYPLWPLVYSITLQGAGRYTRFITAGLMAGAMGCGTWLWVVEPLPFDQARSFSVVQWVCFGLNGFSMIFPLYLTLSPVARARIDSYSVSEKRKREKRQSVA